MTDTFRVVYDGPAVEDHTIDAATLGSSLVALASLVNEAQQVLDPENGARWAVTVTATEPGSFEVELALREAWYVVVTLLNSEPMTAMAVLKTLFGGPGLFELLRWLRGRSPDSVDENEDRTLVRIDDEERTFEAGVGSLYASTRVRKTTKRFVEPLQRDHLESVRIVTPDYELTLAADDRPALEAPIDDDLIVDDVSRVWVRVEAVRFRSDRWEFKDPRTSRLFWATIEDENFLERVQVAREQFSNGDSLECDLRTRQWDTGGDDYKTEYTILRILDHSRSRPSIQGQLGYRGEEE